MIDALAEILVTTDGLAILIVWVFALALACIVHDINR